LTVPELLGVRTPLAAGFPEHPNEHCPECSILLAVDQELWRRTASPSRRKPPIRSARSKSGIRTRRSSARAAAYEANRATRSKHATTPPMRATDQKSSSSSV
jgi:hypothetical protein